jgi:transcriptional regulator with XRE-family HTH domain
MQLDELMTDAAVLTELGRRLTRHRLERNLTQAQLATEAGVGQATVQRAERGESVQMTSMIKLLRTLGLLGGLDVAIPESIDLPIAQLEREQRKRRRRASGRQRRAGGRGIPPAGRKGKPPVTGRGRSPVGGAGNPPADNRDHPPGGGRGGHPPGEPPDQPWTWGDEPDAAA